MFEKKYLMVSLTFFSLFITFCMVNETYAKYKTTATSTTSTSIARWKILVNNDDVTLGSTSTSLITPVFPGNNDINSNVLAPNAEGYFDIILDASNVDVSFKYSITTAVNPSSPVKELVATKYIINGGEEKTFDSTKTVEGIMRLSDTERTVNIRVYVKWDDSLNIMTNKEDTDTTVDNKKGILDVTVSAIQI